MPILSAHWALLSHLLRLEPFDDAMHVELMTTLTTHEGTIVSWYFAIRAATIEWETAYPAVSVIGHPFPHTHCCPALYFHSQAIGHHQRII
jgi:hypothetical protein